MFVPGSPNGNVDSTPVELVRLERISSPQQQVLPGNQYGVATTWLRPATHILWAAYLRLAALS
jgi:hypothetical protein